MPEVLRVINDDDDASKESGFATSVPNFEVPTIGGFVPACNESGFHWVKSCTALKTKKNQTGLGPKTSLSHAVVHC